MMRRFVLLAASAIVVPLAIAQLPPLGEPAKTSPNPNPAASMSTEAVNADLKTARAANADKRFADAETLMLRDTAAKPALPYPWIELGLAQLGLKKYADAESSFKSALGPVTAAAPKQASGGGFYNADGKGTNAHVSISSTPAGVDASHNGEIEGISYASLGEVYIRTNRVPEAKDAFEKAVKANPPQAAAYWRNEAIFFLQIGNAVEQVEAANKAIAVDPTRAALYFFKGQGLAAQATIDPKTQKLILPAGCAEALQKYLDLDPTGQYSTDAKGMLTAAGVAIKPAKK